MTWAEVQNYIQRSSKMNLKVHPSILPDQLAPIPAVMLSKTNPPFLKLLLLEDSLPAKRKANNIPAEFCIRCARCSSKGV